MRGKSDNIKTQKKPVQKKDTSIIYSDSPALLGKVVTRLMSLHSFKKIIEESFAIIRELIEVDAFAIGLPDKEKKTLHFPFYFEKNEVKKDIRYDINDLSVLECKSYKKSEEIIINADKNSQNQSSIYLPFQSPSGISGVMILQNQKKNAYDKSHIDFLRNFVSCIAIAMDNASTYKSQEKIERTYKDTQILNEIGRDIISSLSITDVIEKVYENVNELLDATIIGVGIVNEKEKVVEFRGVIENGEKLPDFNYPLRDKNALSTYCVEKKDEVVINDYNTDIYKYLKKPVKVKEGKRPESILYVPLIVKEKVVGTISVQSLQKNAYNKHDINILRNLALYASIAVEHATVYSSVEEKIKKRTSELVNQKEEIEQTYNNVRLLSKIGQELTSIHDLESIFKKLYANIDKLFDAPIFSVRTCDFEKREIDYTYTIENGKQMEGVKVSLDDDDNYSVWCIKNKKEIFITDHAKDYKKYTKRIVVVYGDLPDSLLFCPMIVGKKIIGCITVQSFKKHAYTRYHLDILRTLSTYTAIAYENARLIRHMDEEVKARTAEVIKQKEQIEKSYQNIELLSEIGKDIVSELSIQVIVSKVYNSLNNLMDASVFGIGLYREENEDLYFSGAMEKGVKLPDFSYSVNDDKIASKCYMDVKEIIINDWSKEHQKYVGKNYEAAQGNICESLIYLPLISKGNPVGVLTVQSFVKNIYTDYHLNIVRSLSIYIASALENASLYNELERRVEERTQEIQTAYLNTKLLSQISREIAESLEIKSIIKKVYNNINVLMDAARFGVGLLENDNSKIKMSVFEKNGEKVQDYYHKIDENNLAAWCFNYQEEIYISNYFEEYKKYNSDITPIEGEDAVSMIYLPLFLKDKIVGILTTQSFEKSAYSEYHLDLLRSLATSIASALENARLYENMEDQVRERTKEVVKQKEIIEEKNKDITDSIRYAQRIQNVMLPPTEEFKKFFKESMVYFRPRDIVSGDFYWMEKIDSKIFFAAVDCTGHGVPGALVSVVGANALNRCLVEFALRKPSDILDKLTEIVTKTFEKTDSNVKDGMDIALCVMDLNNHTLEYSGANNPLWIIREKSLDYEKDFEVHEFEAKNLLEIKAQKQPVGYYFNAQPFINYTVKVYPGDCIYIFSDGYADQFGGKDDEVRMKGGKKFKFANFKKLIMDIHLLKADKQIETLDKEFNAWRGFMQQVDDVCIIGVRV